MNIIKKTLSLNSVNRVGGRSIINLKRIRRIGSIGPAHGYTDLLPYLYGVGNLLLRSLFYKISRNLLTKHLPESRTSGIKILCAISSAWMLYEEIKHGGENYAHIH